MRTEGPPKKSTLRLQVVPLSLALRTTSVRTHCPDSTRTEVRPTKLAKKTLLLPKRPLQPVARQSLPRMSNESWFVGCRQPACKGVRQTPWRRKPSRRAPRGAPAAATTLRARPGDVLADLIYRAALPLPELPLHIQGRGRLLRRHEFGKVGLAPKLQGTLHLGLLHRAGCCKIVRTIMPAAAATSPSHGAQREARLPRQKAAGTSSI